MKVVDVHSFTSVKILKNGIIGIEIFLPNAPPLIVIRGRKGFIMCGYLNINVANKLGLIAARVAGVRSVEEMLNKEVAEVTTKAKEIGIKEGVKVKDVLELI